MNTKILPALAGILLALTPLARAQETTIALGRVSSAGDLQSSANPIGATIASTRPATGEYEITVEAPGAFAGDGVGDFLIQAMVRTIGLTDRACSTRVVSVDPDSLVAAVYVADMEDNGDLDAPAAANLSFQFVIHRLPSGETISPASRYLYATGSVSNLGFLKGGATADGSVLSAARIGVGDYHLTFTKTDAFPSQGLGDFVIFASSGSSVTFTDNIVSGTPGSINSDELQITVRSADVQNASNVNPEADDEAFHFAVYRTVATEAIGEAASHLLLGMASVQGDNGLLRRGLTSIPGAFLTAERGGIGRYNVVVHAPGRFAGRTIDDFVVQVGINSSTHSDLSGSAVPFLVDADSLTVNVRTNDVEASGELLGVAADSDFFLTLHESFAESQPDLRIGNQPALTTMRGNDRYNGNAAGQRTRVFTKPSGAARVHFAAQNDGNTTGAVRVLGRTGKGLVQTRCYRLGGGKQNVTASFRTAGDLVENVRPMAATRYLLQTSLPPRSPKSRAKVRLFSRPGTGAAPLDSASAEILRKR